jgi:hypothetical protein
MKTVTVREFYHNAGLVDGLAEGGNWSSPPMASPSL